MDERDKRLLLGMKGFIVFCLEHDVPMSEVLITMRHDIVGHHNNDPYFCPRTDGYADEE